MQHITREQLTSIGGKFWQSPDGSKQRVYLNNWAELAGLSISTYNTGHISSATLNGQRISNSSANRFMSSVSEFWFDLETQKFAWTGEGSNALLAVANIRAKFAVAEA